MGVQVSNIGRHKLFGAVLLFAVNIYFEASLHVHSRGVGRC